ncbi:MAG: hypothetical protein R3264_08980, partial [Anaerolineae bacterium]|nr:hypothetical protein [Anaerolineae bacterium]
LRCLKGEALDPSILVGKAGHRPPGVDLSLSTEPYGYDVQYLIRGEGLDVAAIRAEIDRVGWSTLVVGDTEMVKVHVHTHQPDQPLKLGRFYGTIHDVVIEDMQQQVLDFAATFAQAAETALLAIVPGPGFAQIFRSLGAQVLVQSPELVTPEKLGAALEQVEAGFILLLPNDPVLFGMARQAVELTATAKTIQLVPAKTIPQGIAALITYDAQASLEQNLERMVSALEPVRTITLTGSNQTGTIVGCLDHEPAGEGSTPAPVLLDILAKQAMNRYEIMTIYFGRGIMETQAQALADRVRHVYPTIGIELYDGGQPDHHYIISLE